MRIRLDDIKEEKMMVVVEQIPLDCLKKGRWYVGRGRNGNVGFWDGTCFLVIGEKFGVYVIKREPYYTEESGCFQPFLGVDEGRMIEPFGKVGWNAHHGCKMEFGAVAVGFPHHVVQRGNNRENVFIDDEDRKKYIELLKKYSRERDARILAYCLMTNHVHLLIKPKENESLYNTRTGKPLGDEAFMTGRDLALGKLCWGKVPGLTIERGRPRKKAVPVWKAFGVEEGCVFPKKKEILHLL